MCGARVVADPSLGDKDPWIYKKGPAFGVPGVHVDGMDVLKVGWRGVVCVCVCVMCGLGGMVH